MSALYNEIDPYAAQWLSNLVAAGHVAPGVVDERSIKKLVASDVEASTQVHFFAGIGVWSYALRLAGWPDGLPIWTGSCPCQPWSSAGVGEGFDDERHLWPDWFRLIKQRLPSVVLGEQVASKSGLAWLDAVSADLEAEGYAFAAVDSCAAGFGAPHLRQRLYFAAIRLADAGCLRVPRLGEAQGFGEVRQGGAFGEMDLLALLERPFGDGAGHPQPLLLSVDDGVANRVGRLCAYGNSLHVDQAVEFVRAVMAFLVELEVNSKRR